MGELQRGLVKWFNDAKGFGFIEHTSGQDVFVHYSVIEWEGFKTLKDGEEVDYELHEGDKGLHAARVLRPSVKAPAPSEIGSEIAAEVTAGDSPPDQISPEGISPVAANLEMGTIPVQVRSIHSMIEVESQANAASADYDFPTSQDTDALDDTIEKE